MKKTLTQKQIVIMGSCAVTATARKPHDLSVKRMAMTQKARGRHFLEVLATVTQ